MAGMMAVSSKPKQIKQMLLLLSKGKQTVANQADNENVNENVNVNGNGNENGKTPSSSSVHGSSCCLINRLTAGCRCRRRMGEKGQGRTTTTPNGIGFVLLDKTGAQGIRGCPLWGKAAEAGRPQACRLPCIRGKPVGARRAAHPGPPRRRFLRPERRPVDGTASVVQWAQSHRENTQEAPP